MNIKFKNRRKFQRINFAGQVNLNFADDSYDHCQIKNLSLTGMFVLGDFKQKQSESCLINYSHQGNTKKLHLRAIAKVVWSNNEGVGLQFSSMTIDCYTSLLSTLINKAKLPSVVLYEIPKSYPYKIIKRDQYLQ